MIAGTLPAWVSPSEGACVPWNNNDSISHKQSAAAVRPDLVAVIVGGVTLTRFGSTGATRRGLSAESSAFEEDVADHVNRMGWPTNLLKTPSSNARPIAKSASDVGSGTVVVPTSWSVRRVPLSVVPSEKVTPY